MKRILFALLLLNCGLSGVTYAQQESIKLKTPTKKTEYFNKERKKLSSAANAYYRVETTYRDSVSGTIREFYPSGKVKEIRPYAHVEAMLRHGTTTTWYEDGKLRSKEDYFSGKQHGERLSYYPDGTLRRRDQFVNGERTTGECFGPNGKAVAYFDYEQMPSYPGGHDAMLREIEHSIRYPVDALRNQTQGKVIVSFMVSEDGMVHDAHVILGLSPTTNKEAIRVVNKLEKFTPALLDGEPVSVGYMVPIDFVIR